MTLEEALAVFQFLDRTNIPEEYREQYTAAWRVIKANAERVLEPPVPEFMHDLRFDPFTYKPELPK